MFDNLKSNLSPLTIERLGDAAAVVGAALNKGQGTRLGQSTVVSNKVHAFNTHSPEHVQILVNADAGRVLYYRQDNGRIGHLDIFHECGSVDHKLASQYICLALEFYHDLAKLQTATGSCGQITPDYVDIQTATGGGRITGCLQGGQKASVQRVHENHVHVTLLLPQDSICGLFYIVAAVETAIIDVGLELRCNECISYVEAAEGQADLSPYADKTDSLLTGQASEQSVQQVRPMPDTAVDIDLAVAPMSEDSVNPVSRDLLPDKQEGGQTYVELAVSRQAGETKKMQVNTCQTHREGLGDFSAKGLYECYRQAVRQVRQWSCKTTYKKTIPKYRYLGSRAIACGCQASSAGFDVTATISAAAERLRTEDLTSGLWIAAKDLRFFGCRQRQAVDICLLVDSSGSMVGKRLQSAKHIASQICRFGCSRISLVTFQDKSAVILQNFTNNRSPVFNAFNEIVPSGATPLALGIKRALAYLKEQQVRKPLLVLITDGMPSKRYDENSQPLTEALSAADEIRKENCGFLCIGLDHNDSFLQKLTASAGGVLFSL